MTSSTPHILMSVSKSLTAIVAGILIEQGKLAPEQKVASIIPKLKESVYSDATVRHVLDMRVGLDFDEVHQGRFSNTARRRTGIR